MANGVKITILGSAAGIPTLKRFNQSVYVKSEFGSFLLDAGDAAAGLCVKKGININDLNSLFVSHMHPDHIGGLAMLIQTMQITGRKEPFKIFLPGEGVSIIRQYLDALYLFKEVLPFTLEFRRNLASGNIYHGKGMSVFSHSNRHLKTFRQVKNCANKCQSYSFKLNIGTKTLIYSGDIKLLDELSPLLDNNADAMILEWAHCMRYEKVALFNNKVKTLIITHIHPQFDNKGGELKSHIKKHFAGNVIIAHDMLDITI